MVMIVVTAEKHEIRYNSFSTSRCSFSEFAVRTVPWRRGAASDDRYAAERLLLERGD
jgi:hypothetical protein